MDARGSQRACARTAQKTSSYSSFESVGYLYISAGVEDFGRTVAHAFQNFIRSRNVLS